MIKTSIRFFENVPVRAVWDDESSKWWFCAVDMTEALTKSKNPRVYWAQLKRRNPQLITICKQLKLTASDGKRYMTDVVDDDGVTNRLMNNTSIISIIQKRGLPNETKPALLAFEAFGSGKELREGSDELTNAETKLRYGLKRQISRDKSLALLHKGRFRKLFI